MKKSNTVRALMIAGMMALSACGSSNRGAFTAGGGTQGGSPTPPKGTPEQLQLKWNANSGEQQGFNVMLSTDGQNFTQVATVNEPARAANVQVSSGTVYYIQVQGYNQAGTSPNPTTLTVNVP